VLFGVLNDKFVAGLIGLVLAHVPRSHFQIFFIACALGLPLLFFRSVQFKKNISQGSVATNFFVRSVIVVLFTISC